MKRTGLVVIVLGTLAFAGTALAQPRVTVGEIKGKGGIMIRGAAVKALQAERSVSLISKDVIAGTGRRMGVEMPKGRREISAALGIGAWIEGTLEREKKTLVTNLSVIDAATGKTLGVMSYDAPNIRALSKAVRGELFADLGELIKTGKVPGAKGKAGADDEPTAEDEEPVADTAKGKHGARPKRMEEPSAMEEPEADAEPIATAESTAEPAEEPAPVARADQQPSDSGDVRGPAPFVLGLGLVGFMRDFVYNDNVSNLPQYDLGLGPALAINMQWYPAAHFSSGAGANIGLDLRGQVAFGLDSQLADKSSFPTSASAFGVGLRGRLPLGKTELGAVIGFGKKSYSIGKLETAGAAAADPTKARMHPFVPSTSYSFLRVGAEARFQLSDKFSFSGSIAYLPTFSTGEGIEYWFPQATASGFEAEGKFGYSMSKSLDLNAGVGVQRFGLSFNPTAADQAAGKPIAGGAINQYISFTLGMGWRFEP